MMPPVGLVAAVIMVIVLLILTGPFQYLPETTLATIVLFAVRGLVDIPALRRLYVVSLPEFIAALAALAGVLVFGMLEGIVIGVLVSFLNLLRRATSPSTAVLGYLAESDVFVSRATHPGAREFPGVLVFRAETGLFYANAPTVKQRLLKAVEASDEPVKVVALIWPPPQRSTWEQSRPSKR
jgi:MFS superfamily sulfate permease-like transporter